MTLLRIIFSGNWNAGGGGTRRKLADGCKCRLGFHNVTVKGEKRGTKRKVRVLVDKFL